MELQSKIHLNPGDLVITTKGEIIWTLLGSCISIIFYVPKRKISAICHALLPCEKENICNRTKCPDTCGNIGNGDFRYVTCSFKYMLNKFNNIGIKNNEIEISLYGGASMFKIEKDNFKIGQQNIEKAKEMIKLYNLKLVHEDTGGNKTRTLTHNSGTGITEMDSIENQKHVI